MFAHPDTPSNVFGAVVVGAGTVVAGTVVAGTVVRGTVVAGAGTVVAGTVVVGTVVVGTGTGGTALNLSDDSFEPLTHPVCTRSGRVPPMAPLSIDHLNPRAAVSFDAAMPLATAAAIELPDQRPCLPPGTALSTEMPGAAKSTHLVPYAANGARVPAPSDAVTAITPGSAAG